MKPPFVLCFSALAMGAVWAQSSSARAEDPLLFVSSFAAGDKGGIHAYRLDLKSGKLALAHRTEGVEHAFFIATTADGKFLYSIYAKEFGGQNPEEVAAFSIDRKSGMLKPLNRQSARGAAACYVDVDKTGKSLLLANYLTGSVAAFPIKGDGSLGESSAFMQHVGSSINPDRQKEPHAHCFVISPDNRFALAADLGVDQILSYRLDAASARLEPSPQPFVRTPPGAGPRHLTFHPDGKNVYVINELANSVTHYSYEPQSGTLIERDTIATLPADFQGVSHTADVKITADGKLLYGTNRGHDSIAAYRIGDGGKLSLIEITPSLGKGPQNLAIAPGGELLLCANMAGDNLSVFRIERATGKIAPVGEPIEITGPSCIKFLP